MADPQTPEDVSRLKERIKGLLESEEKWKREKSDLELQLKNLDEQLKKTQNELEEEKNANSQLRQKLKETQASYFKLVDKDSGPQNSTIERGDSSQNLSPSPTVERPRKESIVGGWISGTPFWKSSNLTSSSSTNSNSNGSSDASQAPAPSLGGGNGSFLQPSQSFPTPTPQPLSRENSQLPFSNSAPKSSEKSISVIVKCQEMELTTLFQLNWTIREARKRIEKKLPPEAAHLVLFTKQGKQGYIALDDDRTIASYKFDEKSKLTVEYQPAHFLREQSSGSSGSGSSSAKSMKKPSGLSTKSLGFNSLRAKFMKSEVNFYDLINNNQYDTLQALLTSDVRYSELAEFNEDGQTPFHAAIRSNNTKIVVLFLNYYTLQNLDINEKDKYGWTVLHHASSNCTGTDTDDDILKLLLNSPGIKVDVENSDNNTPLHYFCQKFKSPSCMEVGKLMIKHAPSTVNKTNKNGETPLHKAIFNNSVRVLMVKLLVEHGADVNVTNSIGGETALHYAVRLGRRDLVKILLNAGADISIKEFREKKSPYELALTETVDPEIANILKSILDLQKWLHKLGLEEYFKEFLRQDVNLETLATVKDVALPSLLDSLKIDAVGHREKLKKEIADLRDEWDKQQFEARLQKAQKTKTPLSSTKQDQVENLKASLNAIINKDRPGTMASPSPLGAEGGPGGWLIKHSDMEFTKELGVGTSGKVFKGLFHGVKVAIKVFKAVDSKTLSEFKKEFHIMSSLRSPHIVHFFGACLEPKICMVMEYCARGSLHDVMKNPKYERDFTWEKVFKFAREMTEGMKALHTLDPPIFHRDMKSLNLLITKEWKVLVADFGLARFNTADNMSTMKKIVGTYAYLSPEIFYAKNYTDKSDVYSMGIVLWELMNRMIKRKYDAPFAEYKFPMDFQIAYQAAEKGVRPTIPPSCPPPWAELVRRCWDKNQETRPNTTQLLEALNSLQDLYQTDPALWNDAVVDTTTTPTTSPLPNKK